MKKLNAFAFFLFMSFVAAVAYAHEETRPHEEYLVTGGIEYTRMYLKPNRNHSFDGNMGGLQTSFQFIPLNSFYAAVGAFCKYGSVHSEDGKRHLLIADAYQRFGYTVSLVCNRLLLTPFIGFAYRHLSHHLHYSGASSAKLRYNEFYIPLGLLLKYKIVPCFSIGFDAIWMPQVYPTLTASVEDGARWAIKNSYKSFIVSASCFYYPKKFKNLSVYFKPSYELWQDGETTASTTTAHIPLGIPKNTYISWIAELGLRYSF